MKRIAHYVLSIILTLTLGNAANAAQWQPKIEQGGTNVTFSDSNETQYSHSFISIIRKNKDGGGNGGSGCLKFGVGPCNPSLHKDFEFTALQVFPMCETSSQSMCIENVNIYKDGLEPKEAKFVGELVGNSWEADPKYGLPASSPGLVFDVPSIAAPSGTTRYLVSATANLDFNFKSGKFELFKFSVGVSPFSTAPLVGNADEFTEIPAGTALTGPVAKPGNYLEGEYTLSRRDLVTEEGTLLVYEDFDPETRVGLSLRMPSEAYGWFSGRVSDPNFTMLPISKTMNRLAIDAKVLTVHRLSALVPKGTVTPSMKFLGLKNTANASGVGIETGSAFDWISEVREFARDKDSATTTDWNLRSSPVAGNCFPRNTFSGLASSNAVAFSWDPPIYKGGYLDYKVAGMHFTENGEVAKGSYDLVIRASILRCLYKIPNVPISATLTVLDSKSGETEYAVATVSQTGDWLKLRATNFTFSNKTLRLKVSTSIKPKTITCVSVKTPKVSKKITAASPKCPSGYKLKN
ncbi:MAG: hypothetical protein KA500_04700 [Rhodoluna sp.]|nr:hypothetical protein [Rhodoluna sp.]MBP6186716.1 hypothetical protein [Rhodoluna sp.]